MIEQIPSTVKAGDTLLCRNRHKVATFKRHMMKGERITVDDLLWRNGTPKKNSRVFCPECHSPIVLHASATYKIHAQAATITGKETTHVPQLFNGDEPVYIVGGGASLDSFNFDLLEGKQVIACNKAMFTCKNASIGFFCDARFFNQHKDIGGNDFWRFRGDAILTTADVELHPRSRVQRIALRECAFSTDEAYIAAPNGIGKNAGWQAINLAYLAGARKIILLGYDCEPGQFHRNKSYAHSSEPSPHVYDRYMKEFNDLATAIKRRKLKLEIINANMASRLTCWPKCPRDEAFTV